MSAKRLKTDDSRSERIYTKRVRFRSSSGFSRARTIPCSRTHASEPLHSLRKSFPPGHSVPPSSPCRSFSVLSFPSRLSFPLNDESATRAALRLSSSRRICVFRAQASKRQTASLSHTVPGPSLTLLFFNGSAATMQSVVLQKTAQECKSEPFGSVIPKSSAFLGLHSQKVPFRKNKTAR